MAAIIKPIISEKANKDLEKLNRYTFLVNTKSNKVEIRKEVEKIFGVNVLNVRTMVYAPKVSAKFTKKGLQVGKTNKLKKAVIEIQEGQTIDIYNNL